MASHALTYAERRELGQCGRCGVGCDEPYCPPCRDKRAEYKAATRARRTQAGKCPACGRRKPAPERAHCAPCQERLNASSRASHARRREDRE
jgi:hypothetical protein